MIRLMKIKTFFLILFALFSLLSPSLISSASASIVSSNRGDSTSASNEETFPLMMFGGDKKYEEKKENLSTEYKTAQCRRDAEAVEQERTPGTITAVGYCEFLNAVAADDPDGLYD